MHVTYMVMMTVFPKTKIKKCGLSNDFWVISGYMKVPTSPKHCHWYSVYGLMPLV